MIANDTYPLHLDSGYLHGAALALTLYRPTRRKPGPKVNPVPPATRLAATVTNLRLAVEQARAALRMGRADLALAALEAV